MTTLIDAANYLDPGTRFNFTDEIAKKHKMMNVCRAGDALASAVADYLFGPGDKADLSDKYEKFRKAEGRQ